MNNDNSLILDEIKENSQIGYAKDINILNKLLEGIWCEEKDLIDAYNIVTQNNNINDTVIILLQLPFLVKLPEKWIKVKSEYGTPYIKFRPIGTIYNKLNSQEEFFIKQRYDYKDFDHFQNGYLENDFYGLLTKTQVLVSFSLWGKRKAYYKKYLESLRNEKSFTSVIVPIEHSWRPDNQALTGAFFEIDLIGRLKWLVIDILNEFLSIYSVACKDSNAQEFRKNLKKGAPLLNYFMMVEGGRVVIKNIGTSYIAYNTKPFPNEDYSNNLKSYNDYLKIGMNPSIYEKYLLDANRQIQMGLPNLAIVQTIMILDWFANEIIENHLLLQLKRTLKDKSKTFHLIKDYIWENSSEGKIRISTLDKFIKYFPIIGIELSSEYKGNLKKIIRLRNEIVHKTQVKEISKEIAEQAVNLGMSIIRYAMNILVNNENNP